MLKVFPAMLVSWQRKKGLLPAAAVRLDILLAPRFTVNSAEVGGCM
jgi:hypothetical protein